MSDYSLATISKGVVMKPVKGIIYGPHNIGKSSFCSGSPTPIFLDLERNIDHLPCHKQKLQDLNDVLQFTDFLIQGEHPFKTMVVDALEVFEQFTQKTVLKEHDKQSLIEIPFGGGFISAAEKALHFRDKLEILHEQRGMNILLIAHDGMRSINRPDIEGHERIETRLNKHFQAVFSDWVNFILYATPDIIITKERGKFNDITKKVKNPDNKRVLITEGTGGILAKNIYKLPSKLPLDWEHFIQQVKTFYQTQGE